MMDEIDLFVKQSYSPEICALFYRAFDMFEELYSDVDYNPDGLSQRRVW